MHVAVDLDWFVQLIGVAFLTVLVLLLLVRNTAFRYFVVDSNFDSSTADYSLDQKKREENMGAPVFLDSCAVCGLRTTKHCARCKMVKYCSGACQKSHWGSGHKAKCEELRSFYKANHENLTSVSRGRSASAVPRNGSSKMFEPANKVLFPYEDFVELFNWDRLGSYPPCGLINCGNSCFANVVLQCLAYTRPLVAYLLEKGHRIECHSVDWCFFCEFQRHVERVSQSVRPFSPINILSRLPNIGANFGYGKQEDAHEFMRFAIDNMQSVCLDKFGGEKAVHPSFQETTLIQHIFGGRLQSQVVCTECDNVSNQFENMMDLTVEIHGDAESLEECLDQFTAKEQLHGDNMYKCDACNAYVTAWKRLLIQRAPNILTIALKRFQSGRFGKLNKKVSFPETLDLSPYKSESEDGNDVYKLYAVIVHVDMLNASFFGHYICYVKDFRGNWYRIDDCKVESVDLDEVLSQGAYMLLYNRICVRFSCLLPHESLRKEENKNLKIQEPAECSSSASECLDNTIDLEQPSSTSGLLIQINSEEELSASVSDAEVEKGDISEPNLPVIKDVELDQGEELSTVTTSSMDIDTNQPDVQNMEFSLVAVEDASQGSKTDASEKLFTKSVQESHVSESCTFEERKNVCSVSASIITHSSSMPENVRSSAAKLKPIFAPGFLGKRPQNKVIKPRDVVVVPTSHLTELVQNQTSEIQRVVISEPNLPVGVKDVEELHDSSEELSTAPEEVVSSITKHINGPHLTNSTFLIDQITNQPDLNNAESSSRIDIEDASQGCITDASEQLPEESHATDSCTFEEDKSTCNNFSSSVITNGELNPANFTCAYKNANLENGSTSSSGDIQDAIKKSDLGNSAAKLKPIFAPGFLGKRMQQNVCALNANLDNGSTSSDDIQDAIKKSDLESSAAKLKPIFAPGFLGKRMRKEVIKPGDEVPANFSKLAPKNHLNDQTKVR